MRAAIAYDTIRIRPAAKSSGGGIRRAEPVSLGIPLPRGRASDAGTLELVDRLGQQRPLQARTLSTWPDGSIRWVLLDFHADAEHDIAESYELRTGRGVAPPPAGVVVENGPQSVTLKTGRLSIDIVRGGTFPFESASVDSRALLAHDTPGLTVAVGPRQLTWSVSDIEIVARGPLRAEVVLHGSADTDDAPLRASARLEMFSTTPAVRMEITLHNPKRALHPGGRWSLGDPGSVLLKSAAVAFHLASPVAALSCDLSGRQELTSSALPFHLLQASSGGVHWDAPTHVTRNGRVTLPFRGYRLRSGADTRSGNHASPTVRVTTETDSLTLAVPRFWETFPQAITVDGNRVEVGMLPADAGDLHELQGGEQTTHAFVLAFGDDEVSTPPLAWCHEPLRYSPDPSYVSRTAAIPYLLPAIEDPHPDYVSLAAVALDTERGFFAKRAAADEYGWRHFGDLPADHESAFQPPDQPFVSHYNNQYDPIAGFALHFLRTGDARWFSLMDDLARHVRDIDVYRTDEDKAAYNQGLFWHTNHYVDAGTSTHRTYPPTGTSGGGPSAEHNYNYGLMLHYYLTGDRRSRDTALSLGQWVIDMDDGRRTPFRWLTRGDTGLASASGPDGYQGAGRGAGHSILACLVAHQLTGSPGFLQKAEQLIRRCVHPHEEVPMQYIEDIEGHWSYTAFLQVVGLYLHYKSELGQVDDAFAYARASLLNHAEWMAQHERPYLDRRGLLDFPTETWVAQDIRKADVFMWAALHTAGTARSRFAERALHFFHYVIRELPRMNGHWFSRPLVLVLTQGYRMGWFVRYGDAVVPHDTPAPRTFPARQRFRPQKAIALQRAIAVAGVLGLMLLTGAGWVVMRLWP